MQYKLTIDINLMQVDANIPGMDTLKRWKTEGKVDLIEAGRSTAEPVYGWPGAPPRPANDNNPHRRGRRVIKKEPAGSPNFKGVAAILFPHKDSQKLNMNEINEIAHIIKHHSSKNELFVTYNLKDYIEGGKRARLKTALGVITMTPDEAVEMIGQIEGWK